MKYCINCNVYHNNHDMFGQEIDRCPYCGVPFYNEYSSDNADDGFLTEYDRLDGAATEAINKLEALLVQLKRCKSDNGYTHEALAYIPQLVKLLEEENARN